MNWPKKKKKWDRQKNQCPTWDNRPTNRIGHRPSLTFCYTNHMNHPWALWISVSALRSWRKISFTRWTNLEYWRYWMECILLLPKRRCWANCLKNIRSKNRALTRPNYIGRRFWQMWNVINSASIAKNRAWKETARPRVLVQQFLFENPIDHKKKIRLVLLSRWSCELRTILLLECRDLLLIELLYLFHLRTSHMIRTKKTLPRCATMNATLAKMPFVKLVFYSLAEVSSGILPFPFQKCDCWKTL